MIVYYCHLRLDMIENVCTYIHTLISRWRSRCCKKMKYYRGTASSSLLANLLVQLSLSPCHNR